MNENMRILINIVLVAVFGYGILTVLMDYPQYTSVLVIGGIIALGIYEKRKSDSKKSEEGSIKQSP